MSCVGVCRLDGTLATNDDTFWVYNPLDWVSAALSLTNEDVALELHKDLQIIDSSHYQILNQLLSRSPS